MQFGVFEKKYFKQTYDSSPINNLHNKRSQKVKTAHMLKVSTNKCLTDVVPY